MSDYEITWDDKKIIPALKREICEKLGEETWDALIRDISIPDPDTEKTLSCKNMRVIIDRLEKTADRETVKGILMRVRHGFYYTPPCGPDREFIECGCKLDIYLDQCREKGREELLKHNAEGTKYWGDLVTDEVLDFMLNTEGVLSPVRKGSELHITRHPYDMTSYFNETDKRRKRFHFCHCLFARTSILSDHGTVSKTMCYCSLGLIISNWEKILGVELDGEIVESVLDGDDICKFIIYLPDEAMKKYL